MAASNKLSSTKKLVYNFNRAIKGIIHKCGNGEMNTAYLITFYSFYKIVENQSLSFTN